MRDPIEIEVTGLLEAEGGDDDTIAKIISAVRRAHTEERTSWLTYNGLRCAAIVPLEVGRVMDTDELPKPVMRAVDPLDYEEMREGVPPQ